MLLNKNIDTPPLETRSRARKYFLLALLTLISSPSVASLIQSRTENKNLTEKHQPVVFPESFQEAELELNRAGISPNTMAIQKKKHVKKNKVSTQIKKLKVVQETNDQKREAIKEVLKIKNSSEAQTVSEPAKQKINQKIAEAPFTLAEKKAVKKMAYQKTNANLLQAQVTLDRKAELLTVAIANRDPQYFLNAPQEAFDLTIKAERRHEAYAFWQLHGLTAKSSRPNYWNEEIGIEYFLVRRTPEQLRSLQFQYQGETIHGHDVYDRLKYLKEEHMLYYNAATMMVYQNHWHKVPGN